MPVLDCASMVVSAVSAHTGLFAYIGPGAGLDLVAYAVSMGLFVATVFSATMLWPVYKLLRWLRAPKDTTPRDPAPADAAMTTAAAPQQATRAHDQPDCSEQPGC